MLVICTNSGCRACNRMILSFAPAGWLLVVVLLGSQKLRVATDSLSEQNSQKKTIEDAGSRATIDRSKRVFNFVL